MSTLTHDEATRLLQAGPSEQSTTQQTALASHLKKCAQCRAYAARLEELQPILRRALRAQRQVQHENSEALVALLRTETWHRKIRRPLAIASGALATLALILLTVLLFPNLGEPPVEPAAPFERPAEPVGAIPVPTAVGRSEKLLIEAGDRGRRDIFVAETDGDATLNLTHRPANDHAAVWSPDGTRIAFLSDRTGQDQVYVINVDGTGLRQLTDDPDFQWIPPLSWSPDGIKLAGTRMPAKRVHASVGKIMLLNVEVGTMEMLTPETNGQSPLWSPAGDRLVYERWEDEVWYLSLIHDDGGSITDIEPNGYHFGVTWSPTGEELVYLTRQGVERVKADGTSTSPLLDKPLRYNGIRSLTWSPDRSYLLFVADVQNNGCWDLHLIQSETGELRRLQQPCYAMRTTPPNWSPDGRWLTFSGFEKENNQDVGIYLMDAQAAWDNYRQPVTTRLELELQLPLNPQWQP